MDMNFDAVAEECGMAMREAANSAVWRCASSLLSPSLCLLSRRLRYLLAELLRRHHGGVMPVSCLSVVLLRLTEKVSASTHAAGKVVVVVVVVASTEELFGPALEGFLESCHEAVGLVSGFVSLHSGHGD